VEEEIFSSLLINSVPELSPAEYQVLISSCGNATALLKIGFKNWQTFIDASSERLEKIGNEIELLKKTTERVVEKIKKERIRVLLSHQGPYPERLRHIYHPPAVLFIQGRDICIDESVMAIVGSRRCTHYGEKVAVKLAEELSEMGIVTVSGLARGIDTHVHWATVKRKKPT
jgi:DNA processing protein